MRLAEAEIFSSSILIVDDQESNMGLREQLLRDVSYVCVTSKMDPQEV